MSDNLIIGMALGFVVGALVVHSSKKAQGILDKGKEMAIEKLEDMGKN